MRKNKGFSLVELIIVIAIMAILVGVMAPQLIKYIEKSKVSSDTQLCGTVQTALVTALADPQVNDASTYNTEFTNLGSAVDVTTALSQPAIGSAMKENLAVASGAEVSSSLKSFNATTISIQVKDANSVSVWLPGTDASGSKGRNSSTSSSISVD